MADKKALIFGVSGQDGGLLARLLLKRGYTVHGTSRDSDVNSFSYLEALGVRPQVSLHSVNLAEFHSVLRVFQASRPDEVYYLAGQSSVALSFGQPIETFSSIVFGMTNVLECVKLFDREIRVFHSASSEMYGDRTSPATEESEFAPQSPYAIAKSASYWSTVNYREGYGLFCSNGILSNHESGLRPRRFVCRKIVSAATEIAQGKRDRITLGNLDVSRDWGWAPEYVDAMWRIVNHTNAEDFIVSTGRTTSLRQFAEEVFRYLGLDFYHYLDQATQEKRPLDIGSSMLSPKKIEKSLGWRAQIAIPDLVRLLVEFELTGDLGPLDF